jgi:hypothetical protein
MRDDRVFAAHMGYTHSNPVRHGLAEHPVDGRLRRFVGAAANTAALLHRLKVQEKRRCPTI